METEQAEKPLVKAKEKIAFLINWLMHQEAMQTIDSYILYFYTDVVKITAGLAGTIGLVVTVWDAINDPLLGQWTVNHKFKNGESVRPHLLYSAIPWAVFFVLIWLVPDMSLTLKVTYAILTRCMLSVFTTILQIPMNTMPYLCSPVQRDRVGMSQMNAIGVLVGLSFSVIGCYPLVAAFGGGTNAGGTAINEAQGFVFVAILFALLGVAGMLFYYFSSKERVLDEKPAEKIGMFKNFGILLRDKNWVNVILFNFVVALTDSSILATMSYYCKYILGDTMFVAYVFGALMVTGLVTACFCGKITKRFGGKGLAVGVGIATVVGEILIMLSPASKVMLIICGCMHGVKLAFSQTVLPLYRGYIGDLLAYKLGGKRIDGMVSTVGNFFKKLGYALTTFLIGMCLQWAQYDGNLSVQPESAIGMLKVMMIWFPLIAGIGALIYAMFINVERDAVRLKETQNGVN